MASGEGPGGGGDHLVVRLRVSDPQWLLRLLLQLGGDAQLLEPTDLAEEVRATAASVLDLYRTERRKVRETGSRDPS